jgi:predicted branched-subunit amino acid permease
VFDRALSRGTRYSIALLPACAALWLLLCVTLPGDYFHGTHRMENRGMVIVLCAVAIVFNVAAIANRRLRSRLSLVTAVVFGALAFVLFASDVPIAAGLAFLAGLRALLVYWSRAIEGEHLLAPECGVCPFRENRELRPGR